MRPANRRFDDFPEISKAGIPNAREQSARRFVLPINMV